MGPSIYCTKQNEHNCGLWVQDLGTFLKKVFIIVEKDRAKLIVTVKHLGHEIGDGGKNFHVCKGFQFCAIFNTCTLCRISP